MYDCIRYIIIKIEQENNSRRLYMRKILMALFASILIVCQCQICSYAVQCSYASQKPNTCPGKPYPISNVVTRNIQRFLGMNILFSRIAESQIKTQLNKIAKGDFDVDLKSYSAMDLLAGKMKSIEVKGKNVVLDDIHVSSIEAKNLCDLIYIDYRKNPPVPLAPLYVGFKGTITEDDLNKTINSQKYKNMLRGIKLSVYDNDVNIVDFENLKISLENEKIYVATDLRFKGLFKFMSTPVKFGTGLKVVDNKIKFTQTSVFSKSSGSPLNYLTSFFEMVSPTIFDMRNFEKNGMKVTLKSLKINDKQIDFEGTIWMPSVNN